VESEGIGNHEWELIDTNREEAEKFGGRKMGPDQDGFLRRTGWMAAEMLFTVGL
jgi:hypothetical protein